MPPAKKLHLVFSFIMGAMMILFMTFVVTWVNLGFGPDFLGGWAKSFVVAYIVGVPTIYFLAPIARRMAARLLGMEP